MLDVIHTSFLDNLKPFHVVLFTQQLSEHRSRPFYSELEAIIEPPFYFELEAI